MKTKELCIHGLLIALVAVCTMVFQIPVSATQGYVHLGDSMILLVLYSLLLQQLLDGIIMGKDVCIILKV